MRPSIRAAAVIAVVAGAALPTAGPAMAATPKATPPAHCGPGSRPGTGMQGRVPAGTKKGFACNMTLLSHQGASGGFKVQRFVDRSGHECAYYDSTLLYPSNIQHLSDQPTGVFVLDMSNPRKPHLTTALQTPAMQTPHESLLLNERRGLLVAVMGNPLFYPGFVDVYDVNRDCRHPDLQSSLPVGLLGHESGFAPDGKTFYSTSLFNSTVTAVDLTNPKVPTTIWTANYPSHGFTVSDDGNRGYIAGYNVGLIVIDTSETQARKPAPNVPEISRLTWPTLSVPQVALPVRFHGKPHLIEVDEFSVD